MQFSNEEYAKECLAHISYFRLKYYWTDMIDEETEHDFHEGASFDDIKAKILSLLDNHKDIPYGKLGFTGKLAKRTDLEVKEAGDSASGVH